MVPPGTKGLVTRHDLLYLSQIETDLSYFTQLSVYFGVFMKNTVQITKFKELILTLSLHFPTLSHLGTTYFDFQVTYYVNRANEITFFQVSFLQAH